jgi:alpha-tubulin suppressor-like RCC1 family protein
VPVSGLTNIEQVSAHYHALARTTAGELWSWGSNWFGQLGDGTSNNIGVTPAKVPGLQKITSIAAGGGFSLAMRSDGTVWKWGFDGPFETFGPATIQPSPVAVPLPGGRRAVSVGAGGLARFAIVG